MIRKTIIVVLTLVTVCMIALTTLSYYAHMCRKMPAVHMWFSLHEADFQLGHDRDGRYRTASAVPNDSASFRSALGYRYIVVGSRRLGRLLTVVEGPVWPIIMLVAAYPTFAFVRGPLRRYRRRRKGLCVKCGYDLTGNVSGVCPECGTEVKRP